MELPEKLLKAIESLSQLPGVGEKTATRLAMTMTNWEDTQVKIFSENILDLNNLNKCHECGMFSDGDICNICSHYSRKESGKLCVVENISDCLAIENSGQFNGLYHILGGVLNPLLGVGPEELRLNYFFERIKKLNITEMILAVNPSVEGDATCSFIKSQVPDTIEVNRIGFGIPIGGSLEYLDPLTISKALENTKIL